MRPDEEVSNSMPVAICRKLDSQLILRRSRFSCSVSSRCVLSPGVEGSLPMFSILRKWDSSFTAHVAAVIWTVLLVDVFSTHSRR